MRALWQIHLWSQHRLQACDDKTLSGASHEERHLNSCYSPSKGEMWEQPSDKTHGWSDDAPAANIQQICTAGVTLLIVSRLSKIVVSAHLMNRYGCSCCQRIKICPFFFFSGGWCIHVSMGWRVIFLGPRTCFKMKTRVGSNRNVYLIVSLTVKQWKEVLNRV